MSITTPQLLQRERYLIMGVLLVLVAMMFPAAAPMILMFGAVYASKRRQEQPYVPTWIFVSAYLLVWVLSGVLAYFLAIGVELLAGQSMWFMENATRMSGAILVIAGLYQLSPLKNVCLAKCRTPLQFILTSWHDGYAGAFRILIFAEKALPFGRQVSQLAGVGLIIYGVLVMFLPAALPMGM